MRPDHLTESELAGYLDTDLDAAERKRVQLHIESCADCRAALVEVMRAVDSFQPDVSPAAPTAPPVRAASRIPWTWVVGAAIAAGAAFLFVLPRSDGVRSSVERAGSVGTAELRPSVVIVAPPENATVNVGGGEGGDTALRFIWRDMGADLYHLALLDETGNPIWTRDVADTSAVLPAEISLTRGKRYFWRVDGIVHGTVASSGANPFIAR